MMTRKLTLSCLVASALASPLYAETYPIGGRWTYEDAAAGGAAQDCGERYMEFRGERRFDRGGAVPDYRNLGWARSGDTFRFNDEFFTGQIRGRAEYQVQIVDEHHLRITMAGKSSLLRRCG